MPRGQQGSPCCCTEQPREKDETTEASDGHWEGPEATERTRGSLLEGGGGGWGVAVSRVTGSKITLAVVRADCKGYEAALDSRREGMVAEPKEVAARGQGDNTLIQDVL